MNENERPLGDFVGAIQLESFLFIQQFFLLQYKSFHKTFHILFLYIFVRLFVGHRYFHRTCNIIQIYNVSFCYIYSQKYIYNVVVVLAFILFYSFMLSFVCFRFLVERRQKYIYYIEVSIFLFV